MSIGCSIIIPSYNTAPLTLRCIQRIQTYPPSRPYEIIVVDNHSSDETPERVRATHPDVLVVRHEANLGFSKACNAGVRRAGGRYILFLNSDTEAVENSFDRLLHWLDTHPGTGIVGPELISGQDRVLQMSWVWNPILGGELIQQYFAPYVVRHSALRQRLIRWLQRQSCTVPSICGACLVIRRETFEQVNGFDENFELYFEDSDLCLRCIQRGWRIDFVAEAKIVHHLGQSSKGDWSATSLIYQQSHIAFYRKHAPRWAMPLLKTYLLLKWIKLSLRAKWREAVRGDFKSVRYCRAYLKMIRESAKVTLEAGIP